MTKTPTHSKKPNSRIRLLSLLLVPALSGCAMLELLGLPNLGPPQVVHELSRGEQRGHRPPVPADQVQVLEYPAGLPAEIEVVATHGLEARSIVLYTDWPSATDPHAVIATLRLRSETSERDAAKKRAIEAMKKRAGELGANALIIGEAGDRGVALHLSSASVEPLESLESRLAEQASQLSAPEVYHEASSEKRDLSALTPIAFEQPAGTCAMVLVAPADDAVLSPSTRRSMRIQLTKNGKAQDPKMLDSEEQKRFRGGRVPLGCTLSDEQVSVSLSDSDGKPITGTGEVVFRLMRADAVELKSAETPEVALPKAWPEAVLLYPGKPGTVSNSDTKHSRNMSISIETSDSQAKVEFFYQKILTAAGYEQDYRNEQTSDGQSSVHLSYVKNDTIVSIMMYPQLEQWKGTVVYVDVDVPK